MLVTHVHIMWTKSSASAGGQSFLEILGAASMRRRDDGVASAGNLPNRSVIRVSVAPHAHFINSAMQPHVYKDVWKVNNLTWSSAHDYSDHGSEVMYRTATE